MERDLSSSESGLSDVPGKEVAQCLVHTKRDWT